MPNYANIVRATQTGLESGYKDTVYVSPISDITVWGRPVDPAVALGDKVKITTAHTQTTGAYAIECKLYSAVATSTTEGDPGEKVDRHQLVFEINGDNPATFEMLKNMLNDAPVFWVKDSDCLVNDSYVQLGDDCKPCDVSWEFNSRKSNETGNKLYTVTVSAQKKFFYLAALDVVA